MNNAPLLGVFGPDFINKPSQWSSILGIFPVKPHFTIPYGESVAGGSYNYFYPKVGSENCSSVFMWPWGAWWSDDKTTDKFDHGQDINRTKRVWDYLDSKNIQVFAGAWPGFHSYYYQGDGRDSLFNIDYRNGQLWTDMLQLAKDKNADHIQLITWNDFGEGTMIEPTREFGYTFLTSLQSFSGTSTSISQLEKIYQMYTLRKEFRNDPEKQAKLNQAFYYFVSMQDQKAVDLIHQVK